MRERGVLKDGTLTDYAFGQFIGEYRGATIFSHGGGIGGYRSALIRFPDQEFAVIVLANADYFKAMTLAKKVADAFIGDLLQDSTSTRAGDPSDAQARGFRRIRSPRKADGSIRESQI